MFKFTCVNYIAKWQVAVPSWSLKCFAILLLSQVLVTAACESDIVDSLVRHGVTGTFLNARRAHRNRRRLAPCSECPNCGKCLSGVPGCKDATSFTTHQQCEGGFACLSYGEASADKEYNPSPLPEAVVMYVEHSEPSQPSEEMFKQDTTVPTPVKKKPRKLGPGELYKMPCVSETQHRYDRPNTKFKKSMCDKCTGCLNISHDQEGKGGGCLNTKKCPNAGKYIDGCVGKRTRIVGRIGGVVSLAGMLIPTGVLTEGFTSVGGDLAVEALAGGVVGLCVGGALVSYFLVVAITGKCCPACSS